MVYEPDPKGAQALLAYVNGTEAEDGAFAAEKYAEAFELVAIYVGTAAVPPTVFDQAVLEVGSKLWQRRSAPNGQAHYDTTGAGPVMTPRDPMVTVYPTLNRFLGGGFA